MPAKREWICDYTDSFAHPQMQEAGFWGMTVFRELCRISGQFSLEGLLPPYYTGPEFIARRLMSHDVTAVRDGVTACVTARLLLPEGDSYRIDGWDRRQPTMPMTVAERKAKSRANKKNQQVDDGCHEESRDVTEAPSAGVTVTLREEKRREEKRVEETTTDHAVSAKPACPVAAPVPEGEGTPKPNVVPLGLKPPGVPKPTPLAPEPPPATDKKPQRTEGPPPHQRLMDALVLAFEAERGTRYAVQDGRDGKAVKWLLGAGTETEVLRRWRVGLGASPGRQRIDCIHELQARWNGLGGAGPPVNGKDLRKGYAEADGRDWTGDGGYGALNKRGAK